MCDAVTPDLIIVGGGAAGLMAAAEAGRLGRRALVLEGQPTPARKLLICGGGRCNATHARVSEADYGAGCRHTLRHVLKTWSVDDTLRFFADYGAPLRRQKDDQYFSADDRARTVLDALLAAVGAGGAELRCDAKVRGVRAEADGFAVELGGETLRAPTLLLTTGGLSYPTLGSDGDGYAFARAFGHAIVPTRPALAPLVASEPVYKNLSGVSTDVRLTLRADGRRLAVADGPLLFTHRGFSGPAVLAISRDWTDARPDGRLHADFLPDLPGDGLADLLDGSGRRTLRTVLKTRLPERLADRLIERADLDGAARIGDLRKAERARLATILRDLPLPVSADGGWAKAEVTAGGVDLKSVRGAALESRHRPGLFFAGEVLDVDGRLGGFNLQWAWASGVAAARGAVARLGG